MVVEGNEPVPLLAVAEDREERERALVDVPPDEREERQVVLFLPEEEREERMEIAVVPHDGKHVEVMFAPEDGEYSPLFVRGVVLPERPEEVVFRAVVRVEGTKREVVVGKREHRPEHGAHRLAPVGERPEVHAVFGASRVGDVVPFVERRRLHFLCRAPGHQRKYGNDQQLLHLLSPFAFNASTTPSSTAWRPIATSGSTCRKSSASTCPTAGRMSTSGLLTASSRRVSS